MQIEKGMNPSFLFQLGKQSWKRKIEFKQALQNLKIDLVSHPTYSGGVG